MTADVRTSRAPSEEARGAAVTPKLQVPEYKSKGEHPWTQTLVLLLNGSLPGEPEPARRTTEATGEMQP